MAVEFTFDFPLPLGLHARPATFIQEYCRNFSGQIIFENLRHGRKGDPKSILSLITSDTQFGDLCRIVISGEGEKEFAANFKRFLVEDLKLKEEKALEIAPAAGALIPRLVLAEKEIYLTGQPASPGIVSGDVFLLEAGYDWENLLAEEKSRQPVSHQAEKEAFGLARRRVQQEIERLLPEKNGVERNILQAHLSIITDPAFIERVMTLIEKDRCQASQAIYRAAEEFSHQLLEAKSQYLRERAADIQDVTGRLLEQMGTPAPVRLKAGLNQPAIIVAEDLFPSDFLSLRPELVQGLILEKAGQTSHTLIMARSQAIPAVTGVDQASRRLRAGEEVILDGNRGVIVVSPGENVRRYYQRELETESLLLKRRRQQAALPGLTADGQKMEIAANIGRPEELDKAWRDGAEGVGIFRTELLLYGQPVLPTEEEQYLLYKRVAEEASGRPVIIRTFDIGGDKPIPSISLPQEPNPFLGYRGIRIYQENYELFRHQVRAILRAAVFGQLKIMFPMVGLVEEVYWLKEKMTEFSEELKAEGLPFKDRIETGIMLEVPSVALLADKFAQEVDFFSVGSNDLIQYFFAADRSNPKVRYLSQPLNPALLRLLKGAIEQAHKKGKWVGLCGEIASDSSLTPVFAGLGFDELSMSSGFIPEVKAVLSRLKIDDCRELVAEAMEAATAAENEELLQQFYQEHFCQEVISPELVDLGADCQSKAEVLQEIAIKLQLAGRVDNRARFEQALWKREDDVATDIGFSLAIPHCQSEAVRTPSIVVLKLKQPVDWESKEDQPVDLIISLAIPAGEKVSQKLALLPKLSRKLIYEDFREALRRAQDPGEVVSLIKQATS
ncbi:MAG TPA: phosphoenolpyruvate--protein phosphotransferase [Candidatus Saccharicenans sp.]|nr:phosphoenolpyruvate--protein phosphotransferase [Candidatus Saccharicenans sp.]HRD01717.1 phosphoenolpyruvate--protein phosphotransferase [Candidatus Saccharicenans sp.]